MHSTHNVMLPVVGVVALGDELAAPEPSGGPGHALLSQTHMTSYGARLFTLVSWNILIQPLVVGKIMLLSSASRLSFLAS